MKFENILKETIVKYEKINEKLCSEGIDSKELILLSKEKSSLDEIIQEAILYLDKKEELLALKEMLLTEADKDMLSIMKDEIFSLEMFLEKEEIKIKLLLIPKDETDAKNAIMELRSNAGGDEAALFAMSLFTMYQKFAILNHWKFEVMSVSYNDIGGLKDCVCLISGKNVFSQLKFESGTHRIQRVPETENSGRIHTSTATVAVLPEMEDVDVKIEDKDLRIDVFRSSGPGGQGVNTTDSAVRITHLPTGIVVSQQDERSQIKNKDKAMKILRAKIYEVEKQKLQDGLDKERKQQIGTGDRSEKIRTYNEPQNRVTDHRIGYTVHNFYGILNGEIGDLVNALIANDELMKLSNSNWD